MGYFKKRYIIREELMSGVTYFMIYCKWSFFEVFIERWNTKMSAEKRLKELIK